jgi:hypothetical protein
MARFTEPTPEQEKLWTKWLSERPEQVRVVAQRFDPWSLFRYKKTGQRVTICGFNEENEDQVTVMMNVTGEFNCCMMERTVFGVDPNSLEPCELPLPGELVGSLLSQAEVHNNIDILRVLARPDLYTLDENGKVIPNDG